MSITEELERMGHEIDTLTTLLKQRQKTFHALQLSLINRERSPHIGKTVANSDHEDIRSGTVLRAEGMWLLVRWEKRFPSWVRLDRIEFDQPSQPEPTP